MKLKIPPIPSICIRPSLMNKERLGTAHYEESGRAWVKTGDKICREGINVLQ